ncbi:MAG: DUF4259 domain-containing protein [Gemmatimonadota bacterium]|nr:DUF4259 domain-containing protein [Gemmatimonadota bacterium]
MGTWSHTPFGNDSAQDWISELVSQDRLDPIAEAIQQVIDSENGYLNADVASVALAAIAILVKAAGLSSETDIDAGIIDDWIALHPVRSSSKLLTDARHALKRILSSDSELRELWSESNEYRAWLASTRSLLLRISDDLPA